MRKRISARGLGTACVTIIAAVAVAACGSSKSSSSGSTSGASASSGAAGPGTAGGRISLSISEASGKARFTAPATVAGGLVNVTLKNTGKGPHSAQFIRVEGNHPMAEVLKVIQGNSNKTPSWIRGEGGVSMTAPGQTESATLNLPAGRYVLTEVGGPGSATAPAASELQVTAGHSSSLPSTPTTLTAATAGKDRYRWDIHGALKAGTNRVTFKSEGADAIHLITAIRVTGHPSKAALIKGLESNGKPPSFFDITSFAQTAVLDGGKEQVSDLNLAQPGEYVLFCPLADRDGGKPHFAEGLLTTVTVH